MAEDVAEGVWGAEKDGSLAVFLVARVIFQRRETPGPTHARRRPRCTLRTWRRVLRWGRNWAAQWQLSGVWLVLWEGASGGAAQSASMFILKKQELRGMGVHVIPHARVVTAAVTALLRFFISACLANSKTGPGDPAM